MNEVPVPEYSHRTVLLDEAVDALDISEARRDGVFVDGTFGRGGHSRMILSRLSAKGRLIAFDKDPQAVAVADALAQQDPRFSIVHHSYATLEAALTERGVGKVDGVLMDLGISSPQVDDAERGFSFRADGPLDMRMDTTRGMSAAEWLANETQDNLEKVIRDYGKNGLLFRLQRRLLLAGQSSPSLAPDNLPRSWLAPSKPAKKAKTRPPGLFRLYGFSSIRNLRNLKQV